MRTAAAMVIGLTLASATFADDGAPSNQVLAEMGLGGMQVVSDAEAAEVRGMGFIGFDGFQLYKQSLHNYKKQVKQFHKQVKKFQHKVDKLVRKWPTGVKHHKMHGGGGWPM